MKKTKKPCELVQALMSSEGYSEKEAEEVRKEMRERIAEGEDPEEVLFDWGLEPDYVFDLI